MVTITYHRTVNDGDKIVGKAVYRDGKFSYTGSAQGPTEHLLKGLTTDAEIEDRLKDAPDVFDGAYFRASYEES